MFDTLIVQPIFNLLVFIYAIIPGHDIGLAVIIVAVIVRFLLWPLAKKQLHHTKAIRELQPEIKRIKKAAAGDRRKESQMVMELYKEREINPFGTLGLAIIQIPILLGLFFVLRKLFNDPNSILSFSYSWLHNLGWLQTLSQDINHFDSSLFGLVDLERKASAPSGLYWPALILVVASAFTQYYQSRMLMPRSKASRSLRRIFKDASKGEQADQQEVMEATGRFTLYIIPFLIILVGINFVSGLALYWLTTSSVAIFQQSKILKEDVAEAEAVAEKSPVVEADSEDKRRRKKSKKRKSRRRRR